MLKQVCNWCDRYYRSDRVTQVRLVINVIQVMQVIHK